jgi:hypothetical protein
MTKSERRDIQDKIRKVLDEAVIKSSEEYQKLEHDYNFIFNEYGQVVSFYKKLIARVDKLLECDKDFRSRLQSNDFNNVGDSYSNFYRALYDLENEDMLEFVD